MAAYNRCCRFRQRICLQPPAHVVCVAARCMYCGIMCFLLFSCLPFRLVRLLAAARWRVNSLI